MLIFCTLKADFSTLSRMQQYSCQAEDLEKCSVVFLLILIKI